MPNNLPTDPNHNTIQAGSTLSVATVALNPSTYGGPYGAASWIVGFDANDSGVAGQSYNAPNCGLAGGGWSNGAVCGDVDVAAELLKDGRAHPYGGGTKEAW